MKFYSFVLLSTLKSLQKADSLLSDPITGGETMDTIFDQKDFGNLETFKNLN